MSGDVFRLESQPPPPKPMQMKALFSTCKLYRYTLTRCWDETLPIFTVIGLNPSTADDKQDDPTIRRCIEFARREGCGTYLMTNLFAWRDTDPSGMKKAAEPIGNDNDYWLLRCALRAKIVLCAWGNHGKFMDRGARVAKNLIDNGIKLHCFRLTKQRMPEHPLYMPANKELEIFTG